MELTAEEIAFITALLDTPGLDEAAVLAKMTQRFGVDIDEARDMLLAYKESER